MSTEGGSSAGRAVPGPVLLVGGLGLPGPWLSPMARALRKDGHDVAVWCEGRGIDCSRRSVARLEDHIARLADESGRAVALVGFSRGGQFARAAGMRRPRDVAALIGLGTPFDPMGVRPAMLGVVTGVAVAGSIGAPGLFSLDCLFGGCCREFRERLRDPWPSGIPFTSIYSPIDEAVPSSSSEDPAAVTVRVRSTHVGLLTSRRAWKAIGEGLARANDSTGGSGGAAPGGATHLN